MSKQEKKTKKKKNLNPVVDVGTTTWYNTFRSLFVIFAYTIFILGDLELFYKECYSTFVEDIVETVRFVKYFVVLVVRVHYL